MGGFQGLRVFNRPSPSPSFPETSTRRTTSVTRVYAVALRQRIASPSRWLYTSTRRFSARAKDQKLEGCGTLRPFEGPAILLAGVLEPGGTGGAHTSQLMLLYVGEGDRLYNSADDARCAVLEGLGAPEGLLQGSTNFAAS